MPGKKPASAAPSRKRSAAKLRGPDASIVAIETSPQTIAMRAIQIRAPNFASSEVARHLEQKVAEEEDAGAEAVVERGQPERGVHLQRGETDVHAIEIGDEIQERRETESAGGGRGADPRGRRSHRRIVPASAGRVFPSPASNSLQASAGSRMRGAGVVIQPHTKARPLGSAKQPSDASTSAGDRRDPAPTDRRNR